MTQTESFIEPYLRNYSNQWQAMLNDNPEAKQAAMNQGAIPRGKTKYLLLEEFVLEHGQQFDASERHPMSKRHRLGECYSNSWQFICERSITKAPTEYTYVEGYAVDPECPVAMLHGWVVTDDGKVIDPTWGWKAAVEYYGIPFDWRFFNLQVNKDGYWGMLQCNQMAILKGKWHYQRAAKFPAPEYMSMATA